MQEVKERREVQTKSVDEFLKFYKEWDSTVDKKKLETIVKNVYEYYMTPEEAGIFFDGVSTFIENKVREKTGFKSIKVLPKVLSDEVLLVATINVKLDKPRRIELAEYDFVRFGEVAESVKDFDDFLNYVISDISNEAKGLMNYLKRLKR